MDNPMLWWSLEDVPSKHIIASLHKAIERFCIRFPTETSRVVACDVAGYRALYYAIVHEYAIEERPNFIIKKSITGMEYDLTMVYDGHVFANSWYIGGQALAREVVKERA